ncbi:MAG: SDR family NAD(P)-dependent oxidoreductase, partial [Mycobacterium sp.]
MRLDGQVAVVTGGASGIGAAVVSALEEVGVVPVIWDRELSGGGVVCDVSDPAAVSAAMEQTIHGFGEVTLMVTCA